MVQCPTDLRMQGLAYVCLALFCGAAHAAKLTSLVNLFIGTASGANGGSGGNAFPGAAIPHAMVKVHITFSRPVPDTNAGLLGRHRC